GSGPLLLARAVCGGGQSVGRSARAESAGQRSSNATLVASDASPTSPNSGDPVSDYYAGAALGSLVALLPGVGPVYEGGSEGLTCPTAQTPIQAAWLRPASQTPSCGFSTSTPAEAQPRRAPTSTPNRWWCCWPTR